MIAARRTTPGDVQAVRISVVGDSPLVMQTAARTLVALAQARRALGIRTLPIRTSCEPGSEARSLAPIHRSALLVPALTSFSMTHGQFLQTHTIARCIAVYTLTLRLSMLLEMCRTNSTFATKPHLIQHLLHFPTLANKSLCNRCSALHKRSICNRCHREGAFS